MSNDQNNPFAPKRTNILTSNKEFDLFKRCSFIPDLFIDEDDESPKQKKSFVERTNRSKSHYHYHCRPEFVPKPKPKRARVVPSPMKLKSKFVLCNNESDHCLSPLESEEEFCLDELDTDDIKNDKNEIAISDMRKTLTKIKTSPIKKQAKDSEQALRNSSGLNFKKQRRSVFTKSIKGFIEDEKENNKNVLTMSIGPVVIQKNISILGVLEQTAGNISQQLNLNKCKSTII